MFEETRNQSFDIMPPTDTTEKSKGVLSAEEAKVLVDLRKDSRPFVRYLLMETATL